MSLDGGCNPPDLQSDEAAGDVTEATLPKMFNSIFKFLFQKEQTKFLANGNSCAVDRINCSLITPVNRQTQSDGYE